MRLLVALFGLILSFAAFAAFAGGEIPESLKLAPACQAKILVEAKALCDSQSKGWISRAWPCRLEASQLDHEVNGEANFELIYSVGEWRISGTQIDSTAIWDYLVTVHDRAACRYSVKITDF